MLLGVIADDFTGAGDIANTLAKGSGGGGLKTVQFLGVPDRAPEIDCEAGVVALKSRSLPAAEAVRQSLAALDWLRSQGCRQFVFKYCSTFDSTPAGNIGPVGEALARELGVGGVVACPAFPALKRSVYMGHLFVGDRLLNESGMQNHPLTPMTDSDIRRWLARQCSEPVGLVPLTCVSQGPDEIRSGLDRASAAGERLVIVDAVADADLIAIGRACSSAPLLTGGSGIALGLAGNFIDRGEASGKGVTSRQVSGPEAVLAGSCSGATLEQIQVHARTHPVLRLDAGEIVSRRAFVSDLVGFIRDNEGHAPLIYSSSTSEEVSSAQNQHGRERVAQEIEQLFSDLARSVVDAGVRRLVVAGGETSGAVVGALGLDALAIGKEIDPGIPILYGTGNRPLALALKSGNFGSPAFFDKALAAMESAS